MSKGNILIADDEKSIRDITKAYIERDFPDYDPEVFENGNQLENRIKKILVEGKTNERVIIADNNMSPGARGSKLIELYAEPLLAKYIIPMILQYAGDESIGQKAIQNGAFDYLIKPFTQDEFVKIVKYSLDFSE